MFFSGLIIALTNNNFRNTYENISAPSEEELAKTDVTILESYNLNEAILKAISTQISTKMNNLSKSLFGKISFHL